MELTKDKPITPPESKTLMKKSFTKNAKVSDEPSAIASGISNQPSAVKILKIE
jgi:hypothetical protein